jgi:hypothetical protein
MTDMSTCEDRLTLLAAQPEHAAIRGELLHAATELKGLRDLLAVMQTEAGWRTGMGYTHTGTCHGCGQDIWLRNN